MQEDKLREYRREKKKEKKRKEEEESSSFSSGLDPDMAAIMGFSGFSTSKK